MIAALVLGAHAAEMNGPMSSAPKPDAAATPTDPNAKLDVEKLFANTCGWCHSKRIKHGKPGAMPAFETTFSDEQLKQIVAYIRGLK